MEKRAFGKTDMEVSVLGFGGAEIGFQNVSAETVERILSSALDAGLNVIDTAECYEGSEELIGKSVSHRRKDYYLFTKVGHTGGLITSNWGKSGIEKCIDRSLQRLKTDYLDLVQLHSCDEKILRRGEAIEALEQARKAGKTRYIGYSGDSTDALYAINVGTFDTFQTSINIADQEAIDLTIPIAKEKGMAVIAKRPVANAAWRLGNKPVDGYSKPYWDRLRKLQYDFIDGDLSAAMDVALRFTLSVPGVHTAIVGTTRPERWHQNAELVAKGALPVELYDEIRQRWLSIATKTWVGQV